MPRTSQSQKAYEDISLHTGIAALLAFVVFVLIFGEDWTNRYQYLCWMLFLPAIALLVARRYPMLGGILLINLGFATFVFDWLYSPAHPGQIAGRGLGFTLFFVVIPLVLSGIFHLILWNKFYRS